jgi:PadR family transcriptional regulator PadR
MDTLLPSLPTLLILSALEHGPAHGYEIARRVHEESGGLLDLKEGTLYPRLYQLEREGLLVAQWTTDGSGRRIRRYELTATGRDHLRRERPAWRARVEAAERVLFSEGRPGLGTV